MRKGWLITLILVIAAIMLPGAVGGAQAQEVQGEKKEDCLKEKWWKPKDLPGILEKHSEWVRSVGENHLRQWAEDYPEGRANLCNADLRGATLTWATLTRADLTEAILTNADLGGATLTDAVLRGADLSGADLTWATLTRADLTEATLTDAVLGGATLLDADLGGATLTRVTLREAVLFRADLRRATLREAVLSGADLSDADLTDADLHEADLSGGNLTWAILTRTDLREATLRKADLGGADLRGATLTDADLAFANLTGAIYAPASPPPDAYIAGIRRLRTIVFPSGQETGLVQLRELLHKAGLRDLEREATYAIERGRTWHAICEEPWEVGDLRVDILKCSWKAPSLGSAEGLFRFVAFDLTTAYGDHPSRALIIIIVLWGLLIPVYAWTIFRIPYWFDSPGIYRIWSKERIEASAGRVRLSDATDIEHLSERNWRAITWAAYFSLLSAFNIGFRDFNVGNWIARIQADKYTLEPTGWVRVLSGFQSLLSVYLLAIWALTYFGRPFQ